MSATTSGAVLAAGIATSLMGSGIGAMPELVDDGSAWVALILDDRAGVVAWLDVADMSYAVTVHQDGSRRLIAAGPLAGLERCSDARCIAGSVVAWVMLQRSRRER
ncbi:hypothetical protein KIN34_06325 [Cellulomonas sp. DKR-3]|uniref:Uncharacterized protein n=1 Tax=Cellulomonas fulva TaxID=2835530 RepID=A0ABS5TXM4_9CELL|nr:hypothetical protein [Cellulomonas fulva]MBT0993902.1 hypothetical protein [Cellulomonas fulva]